MYNHVCRSVYGLFTAPLMYADIWLSQPMGSWPYGCVWPARCDWSIMGCTMRRLALMNQLFTWDRVKPVCSASSFFCSSEGYGCWNWQKRVCRNWKNWCDTVRVRVVIGLLISAERARRAWCLWQLWERFLSFCCFGFYFRSHRGPNLPFLRPNTRWRLERIKTKYNIENIFFSSFTKSTSLTQHQLSLSGQSIKMTF